MRTARMAVPRTAVAVQSRAFGASAIRALKESDRRTYSFPGFRKRKKNNAARKAS